MSALTKLHSKSKLDHQTLHYLPFLATKDRKGNYLFVGEWGNQQMILRAYETLNTYDLKVLLYVIQEYLTNHYVVGDFNGRPVVQIAINVESIMKRMKIHNKKVNRKTFRNSIERLKSVSVAFINKITSEEVNTTYIYEFEVDKDIKTIVIFANKKFIEYILKHGITIELERINKYKSQYTVLLDLYISGTKKKINNRYVFRTKYTYDELLTALKLNNLNRKKIMQIIRKSFQEFKQNTEIEYIFDKYKQMWLLNVNKSKQAITNSKRKLRG